MSEQQLLSVIKTQFCSYFAQYRLVLHIYSPCLILIYFTTWNLGFFYRFELHVSHKSLFTLTGNYNGNPNDDNIKSNGDIASDSTDLGESWLVPENNTMYVKSFHHVAFAEQTPKIKYPSTH